MKNYQRGMSLIEVLIAIGILAVAGTAIINVSLQVFSLNNTARLSSRATALKEETLEQVRNYFQQNAYTGLLAKSSALGKCYSDGTLQTDSTCIPNPVTTCDTGTIIPDNPSFRRSVMITQYTGYVGITAVIIWQSKDVCERLESTTQYYAY